MTNDDKKTDENKNTKEYLYKRLAEIQQNLKAPKTKEHFQGWKHRSAEDILNAVKPLLDGESIILSDEISSVFPPFMYEKTEKNTKINSVLSGIYIKSTATLNNGSHSISASSCVKESADKAGLDDPQISGIATSYARKYALCGLLGIDGSDDADEHNDYQHRSQAQQNQPPAPPKQATPQKTYSNQSSVTTATDEQKEKWKQSLIKQAGNDESLLYQISDNYKFGIKSEKQYYFYSNKLLELGKG